MIGGLDAVGEWLEASTNLSFTAKLLFSEDEAEIESIPVIAAEPAGLKVTTLPGELRVQSLASSAPAKDGEH
jgi:hypothetical protein